MNPTVREWLLHNAYPSRGHHISDTWDLYVNWEKCREYYGPEFNFQYVNFKRNTLPRVMLPSVYEFKINFLKYLCKNDSYDTFKTQWVLNDFIINNGWKFPVQAVYNWKMKWWEIHPGRLRGLIYNFLEVEEWPAWYMPMDNTEIEYTHKFYDVDTLLTTMGFTEYYRLDGELIQYFDRPMIKLCVQIRDLFDAADYHKELFFKNISQGLNLEGDIVTMKKEISKWPQHPIKDRIVFNQSGLPTLNVEKYTNSQFYAGLHFFGTKINKFHKDRISYSNPNQFND